MQNNFNHHHQMMNNNSHGYGAIIPLSQNGQPNNNSGQAMGNFQRQDSLAICSKLQDQDREQGFNMMEFMETNMNIDEYIECFKAIDVPVETVDLNDTELQKSDLLYDQQEEFQYDPFAPNPNMNANEHFDFGNSSTSSRVPSAAPTPAPFQHYPNDDQSQMRMVKKEMDFGEEFWDGESEGSVANSDIPSTSKQSASYRRKPTRDAQRELATFKPTTRARKYNPKPDEEKVNPTYKLKRARNNDAVRKSRTKQKEQQVQRETELSDLRHRVQELEAELGTARAVIADQKTTISRLMQNRR